MKKQFREATPKEIDKIVKTALKMSIENKTIGLSEDIKEKLINEALIEAHRELGEQMLKKLDKFKSTGNKQLDSEILIRKILGPLIESTEQKIINKLITDHKSAVKEKLKAEGIDIENT